MGFVLLVLLPDRLLQQPIAGIQVERASADKSVPRRVRCLLQDPGWDRIWTGDPNRLQPPWMHRRMCWTFEKKAGNPRGERISPRRLHKPWPKYMRRWGHVGTHRRCKKCSPEAKSQASIESIVRFVTMFVLSEAVALCGGSPS